MKDLVIEKTYGTPKINFSFETGVFTIEGRSIPENPVSFYEPIGEWMEDYFKNPRALTKLEIKLDYINSGSSKSLLGLLKIARCYCDQGRSCVINWYFEEDDESIRDLGKHYNGLLRMPFNLVEVI
jgi:hypothetical protein